MSRMTGRAMWRTGGFYGRDDRGSVRATSTSWLRVCRLAVGALGLVLGLGVLELVCLGTGNIAPLVFSAAARVKGIAGDVIETDPAVQPWLHRLLDGTSALHLDAKSIILGVSPEELAGYLASVLGAITVLVAGSVWRRRRLNRLEKPA